MRGQRGSQVVELGALLCNARRARRALLNVHVQLTLVQSHEQHWRIDPSSSHPASVQDRIISA
jgi:hypothetical protein